MYALEDLQEQGEDDDPEGNADNTCDWEKARPAMLSNLSQRRWNIDEAQKTARL